RKIWTINKPNAPNRPWFAACYGTVKSVIKPKPFSPQKPTKKKVDVRGSKSAARTRTRQRDNFAPGLTKPAHSTCRQRKIWTINKPNAPNRPWFAACYGTVNSVIKPKPLYVMKR
ncbi:hypothetical protein quinque_000047, partial [Culex quinquefasciatus]